MPKLTEQDVKCEAQCARDVITKLEDVANATVAWAETVENCAIKAGKDWAKESKKLSCSYSHAQKLRKIAQNKELYLENPISINEFIALPQVRVKPKKEKKYHSGDNIDWQNKTPKPKWPRVDVKFDCGQEPSQEPPRNYGYKSKLEDALNDIFSRFTAGSMEPELPSTKEDAYLLIGKLLHAYADDSLTKLVLKQMKQRLHPDKATGDSALFSFISQIEEILNV
jgi:hypothetical protein